MPYQVGDCLLIKDDHAHSLREHLHVIVTAAEDHAEGLMLLPCIESRHKHSDTSCTLSKGVHPFITHASVVEYRHAKAYTAEGLDAMVAEGSARPAGSVSTLIVSWIIAGAYKTKQLNQRLKRLLPPAPQQP